MRTGKKKRDGKKDEKFEKKKRWTMKEGEKKK